MKEIKILGTGCKKCKELYKMVIELAPNAKVEKVEDITKIIEYNVMSTPALVIDGKVVHSGGLPSKDELKKMLEGTKTGTCSCGGCC